LLKLPQTPHASPKREKDKEGERERERERHSDNDTEIATEIKKQRD